MLRFKCCCIFPNSQPQIRPDAIHNRYHSPLPHTYLDTSHLPDSFSWGDVDGVSYLTHSLNQHLPQVRVLLGLVGCVGASFILPACSNLYDVVSGSCCVLFSPLSFSFPLLPNVLTPLLPYPWSNFFFFDASMIRD